MSTAQIHITLKPALLDTQGTTVLKALHQLGHDGVRDVRIGKLVEVQLDDTLPPAQQQAELETMCRQLLANPVIEDFSIVLSNDSANDVNAISSTGMSTSSVATTPVSFANETAMTVSPTNPIVDIAPSATTQTATQTTTMPVSDTEPLGSEPTAIGEPFAVSYDTYQSMTADEKLDLQGRAWNLHGTPILRELDARRAAWLVWCGNRVLESGATLDSLPTDAFLAAVGAKTDLVPFVFTRPPQ